MTTLKIVKPSTEAERTTKTTTDTIEITPNLVRSWKLPPFQRPLRVNEKLMAIAKEIAVNDGVVPSVITLGVLKGDDARYLIDGQHRREAFLLSECPVGYVDLRVAHYDSMADMAEEFWKLNSRIVNMRPDDLLRAVESSNDQVAKIRKRCPFVGYDQIRRGEKSPILSMSSVIRCWHASAKEAPQPGSEGAMALARQLEAGDVDILIGFLDCAMKAWGRDPEYARLWSSLNLSLCMWLYRRMVVTPYSAKTPKLVKEEFTTCLMSLSSDAHYLDWLVGRHTGERDRSPCYRRVKELFSARLEVLLGKKPTLPQPGWAASK